MRAHMERHGIAAIVGASCIFATLHEALAAAGMRPEANEPGSV
ncbi:hypothetical protein [Burkholderia ubonensis]|nr:hypothetical protein [Burkholderia ubonensis]